MTISSEVAKLQQNLEYSYSACSAKGATIPQNENFDNLATTISTIPTGGGSGTEAKVKAIGTTTSATEDDKVILKPTDNILYHYNNYTRSSNPPNGYVVQTPKGGILDDTQLTGYQCYSSNSSYNNAGYVEYTLDTSNIALVTGMTESQATSSATQITQALAVDYRDDFQFAYQYIASDYSGSYQRLYSGDSLGHIVNGTFQAIGNCPGTIYSSNSYPNPAPVAYVDRRFSLGIQYYGALTDSAMYAYQLSSTNGETGTSIPVKFNNVWYVIKISTTGTYNGYTYIGKYYPWGVNIVGYSLEGNYPVDGIYVLSDDANLMHINSPNESTAFPNFYYVDDNTDYFFAATQGTSIDKAIWGFYKLNKTTGTWKFEKLTQPSNVISSSYISNMYNCGTVDWFGWFCKDWGDTVEIIMSPQWMEINSSTNKGSYVAHFIFDKKTETMTRLPDIFSYEELAPYCGTSITGLWRISSAQVNWDLGLISIIVEDFTNANSNRTFNCFIKNKKDLSKIYLYYSYENTKANYEAEKDVTGFVKENLGTNELGDTELKVETTPAPGYGWQTLNTVFGMEVTVDGD